MSSVRRVLNWKMNTASREEKRQAVAVRGRKRGASSSRSQTTRPAAASVSAAAGDVKAEESKSVVMDVKEENVIGMGHMTIILRYCGVPKT